MRAELEGTLGVSPAEAGDLESRCSLPCSVQSFSGKHVFFPTLWHSSRVKFQVVNSCKKGVQILVLNPPRRVCRAVLLWSAQPILVATWRGHPLYR